MSGLQKRLFNLTIIIAILLGLLFILQSKINEWLTTESTDNAYVDANISTISPEINGVIRKINVSENSNVSKDDPIVEIEDINYKAKLEQAKVQLQIGENALYVTDFNIKLEALNLLKLKDSLKVAESDLEIAEREYKRNMTLNKEKFSSAKILDNAKSNLEKAKYALSKTKLDIQSSEYNISLLQIKKSTEMANLINLNESLKLAERDFQNAIVKAPVQGILTNLSAKLGNYASTGHPLFSIVQRDDLTIKANFKETQIRNMKPGMPVFLTIDTFKGQKFYGKIRSISPATGSKFSLIPNENSTGNFTKIVQRIPVIIEFESPEEFKNLILPGMSAIVHVQVK